MKLDNKGQALVEFVLILPLFLMLLFVIIDFGVIFSTKNSLETESTDIISLLENDTNIEEVKSIYPKLDITITNDQTYMKVTTRKYIDLITPGLNKILDNPYEVKVERIIPYD